MVGSDQPRKRKLSWRTTPRLWRRCRKSISRRSPARAENSPIERWSLGAEIGERHLAELGLAIKQDSPFPRTIIAELANGAIGYIPSRRAYAQGNYEVISARCAEGSGERLVDAAVRLLKELYDEESRTARKETAAAGRPK